MVRFPRIAMGLAVGAALAVAGAVMQAIFGNPLAEPGVVGVSSGAALGRRRRRSCSASPPSAAGRSPVLAFVGGLLATLLVYFVSRANGRTEVVTLLLTGIAVNAFAGAGLAFLLFVADTASREQIVFWQLGSLNGSRWREVAIVAVVAAIGTVVARSSLGRRYDLLALGERNARHLGVNVEALRIGSIVLVALLTGVAVAFCGIIAFVGLVVPHIIRMAIGPSHRPLIVASAVGGGAADRVRRPARAHDRPRRRPADRHAHLARRRAVLLLPAVPPAPAERGLGMTGIQRRAASASTSTARLVVRDVDLDVPTGEVLALVGPNGAGKSTLLAVCSRRAAPSSGGSLIDERAAHELRHARARAHRASCSRRRTR